jgi:hypothetical protein
MTEAFPCTEQGIRDAIAEGGGPQTFACEGPQTIVTEAEIVIDNNVILDGNGNLTVDGNDNHSVFSVAGGVTAELRGFGFTNGDFGISSFGTLTMTTSTVSGSRTGIASQGVSLTVMNSTVSGDYVGITAGDGLRVINSTISSVLCDPSGCVGGISLIGADDATVTNSTLLGGGEDPEGACPAVVVGCLTAGGMTLTNTVIDGGCRLVGTGSSITSLGYNIESPGSTCGFDTNKGDQFDVTAEQLNLGALEDNGGPTMTHALLPGSVAIDKIPEADCEVTTDQRGQPRPETGGTMCDVGAFEVQP